MLPRRETEGTRPARLTTSDSNGGFSRLYGASSRAFPATRLLARPGRELQQRAASGVHSPQPIDRIHPARGSDLPSRPITHFSVLLLPRPIIYPPVLPQIGGKDWDGAHHAHQRGH